MVNLVKFAMDNWGKTPMGRKAYMNNLEIPRNAMASYSSHAGILPGIKLPPIYMVSNAKLNHYKYNWKLGKAERVG